MHVEKACSIGSRSSTPRNHLNDFRLLLWSELRTAAADASLPASAFQTHLGTFAKHNALELSKRTEHLHIMRPAGLVVSIACCPTARIWIPLWRALAVMKRSEKRSRYS
jgi:hypothetical protein